MAFQHCLLSLVVLKVLFAPFDLSEAIYLCGNDEVFVETGQTIVWKGNCQMPLEMLSARENRSLCADNESFAVSANFPGEYEPTALIAKTLRSEVSENSVILEQAFRGLDNLMGSKALNLFNLSWSMGCESEVAESSHKSFRMEAFYQLLVRVQSPPLRSEAWTPPKAVAVPCLLAGRAYALDLEFASGGTRNNTRLSDTVTNRPLLGWMQKPVTQGSQLEQWLNSRPASKADEALLLALEPGQKKGSLIALLRSDAVLNQVRLCIYPGDGYNYYDQLCTSWFGVQATQEDCESLPISTSQRPISSARASVTIGALQLLGLIQYSWTHLLAA